MERKRVVVRDGKLAEVYEQRGTGGGRLRPGGLSIYAKDPALFSRPGGQKVPRRQHH